MLQDVLGRREVPPRRAECDLLVPPLACLRPVEGYCERCLPARETICLRAMRRERLSIGSLSPRVYTYGKRDGLSTDEQM